MLLAAFLVCVSILLSGCAAGLLPKEESQFFQGDMNEIVRGLGPQFDSGVALPSDKLVFLCLAYINRTIISKANKCADALERAIAASKENRTFGLGPFSSAPWLVRAEASLATGDYQKAVGFAKNARDRASAEQDWMVGNQLMWMFRPMSAMAVAYVGLGEHDKAEQVLKTLEGTEIGFAGGALAEQALRTELFKIYLALGKYDAFRRKASESNAWFAIGRPLVQATWGQELDTEEQVRNQFAQNFVALKLGETETARAGLEGLLRDRSLGDFGSVHWKILHVLGGINRDQGDLNRAIERLKAAVDVIERQRSSIEGEASKIGYVGDKQAVYSDLIDALIRADRFEDAFEYIERAKSRALVDMLASRQSFSSRGNGTGLTTLIQKLDQLEAQSIQLAALDAVNSRVRGAELIATKKTLRKTAPELATLVSVGAVDTAEIQSRLARDEAIVEFFNHGTRMYVVVVTRTGVNAQKLDGTGVADAVQNARGALQAHGSNEYAGLVKELFDRLIRPVSPRLMGIRKLTVIPHGALHYLPFSALHDGDQFLIDRYDLRLLPSASVLKFVDKKGKAAQQLLAFGNPDLGDPKFDLPGAEEETKVIDQDWKGTRILLRKLASEANFKKFAPNFRMLHLASHGEFNPENPLQSRMLLAPGDGEDGNLTVDELYDLRLNADMVTLSACETGLGNIKSGDDVIGLTRGFLYAGVNSVVASLWPVADDATAFLMKRFYRELKTNSRVAALRAAILATKEKFTHPVFWSAFGLTGASG